MPKLLFETDDGKQSEISLKTISSKGLKDGDIVFASYELGPRNDHESNTDKQHINEVMSKIQVFLEKILPDGVKCVVIARHDGKDDLTLKITKDKTSG